ncbi:MAG: hypothetical protein IKU59_00330 [Bacteroidales bacterium]|nr:hypothetical protein [Bacteroidales bacterium]MBR5531744.1 hypothetical protein [Bacteroidales bacterium]
MKNIFFVLVFVASLLFVACDNNEEARNLYFKAVELYNEGNYSQVKATTDSIKIVDNTAFDEIRAGLQLSRKAELAINENTMLYADSMLKILQKETEQKLKDFDLIKNEEYQTSGNLVYKHDPNRDSQTKSCLRVYVTEDGEFVLLSVHSGSSAIEHESFKLSLNNGSFILSDAIPYDGANNYRYKINGMNVETITHKEPKTLAIAQFVIDAKGAPIKVSYDGKKPYSFTLEKSTRKAIIESYELAEIIKQTKKYQRNEAIASQTIAILKKQIEEHKGDSI